MNLFEANFNLRALGLPPLDLARPPRQSVQRQPADPHLLRTPAAASYLGMSPWKLRQLVYAGEVAVIKGKYWLFSIADLEAWVKANRERG